MENNIHDENNIGLIFFEKDRLTSQIKDIEDFYILISDGGLLTNGIVWVNK